MCETWQIPHIYYSSLQSKHVFIFLRKCYFSFFYIQGRIHILCFVSLFWNSCSFIVSYNPCPIITNIDTSHKHCQQNGKIPATFCIISCPRRKTTSQLNWEISIGWGNGFMGKQTITWPNFNPALCSQMVSLGHNELISACYIANHANDIYCQNSNILKSHLRQ